MLGLLFFIALYGAVLLRHRVRHRDEAELLESKVRERTAELEGLLSERAAMLHEMHHRVKNNLQLVASLLRLESDRIEDPRLSAPLDAGVRRIDAMALVHDALYDAERLDLVDFGDYARSVVATIARETGFCIDFSEEGKVLGRLDLAVPFGLLLHELATNAQKHAFPGGGGCAKVGLAAREGMVELRVEDEGVGMGSAATGTAPGALGLDLVRALVSQLRGTIERLPGAGTLWLLRFPLDPSAKPDSVA